MSLQDSLADDYSLLDGIEPVILHYQPKPDPSDRLIPSLKFQFVPHALRRERDLIGSAGLPMDGIIFHLWTAGLNGITLNRGAEVINQQGEVFIVQSAKLQTMGSRYRCICGQPDAGVRRYQPWTTLAEFQANVNAPVENFGTWQPT